MAINTPSRRASLFGVGFPPGLVCPEPDGSVGDEDRQHVAFVYAGIAAGGFAQATTLGDLTTLFMDEYYDELKAASVNAQDVNTLVEADLDANVRAQVADQDDLNTMYAIYISST